MNESKVDDYKEYANYLSNQQINSKDLDEIEYLKGIIKQYDTFDFLAGISALMLIPENQSKTVIFNCIICATLSVSLDQANNRNRMGISKFREIVSSFEKLSINEYTDPAEFPFVQRLIFYKNYNIFMGISEVSTDDIQGIFYVLSQEYQKLSRITMAKINTDIMVMLELTTEISKNINYSSVDYPYDSNIKIPNKSELERLKQLIVVSPSYLDKYCYNEEEYKSLFCNLNNCKETDYLSFNNQYYYLHPFLRSKDDKYLILDITLFPNLLMKKIISHIINDCNGQNLINTYGNNMWQNLQKYFLELGNFIIDEQSVGLNLIVSDRYKERILSLGNDGIIINIGLFDNGTNYNSKELLSSYNIDDLCSKMNNRLNYIVSNLITRGIKIDNIYLVVSAVLLGRSMGPIAIYQNKIKAIVLQNYELRALSINEKNSNMFLKRYIIAKSRLVDPYFSFFSELNLIALYALNDYSFYVGDEFDTKQAYLDYVGEYSKEYILSADTKTNIHLVSSYNQKYNIVVTKDYNNIYYIDKIDFNKSEICIETGNILIWLVADWHNNMKIRTMVNVVIEFLSYWFDNYFNNCDNYIFLHLTLEISLVGNIDSFFIKEKIKQPLLEECINLRLINSNKVLLEINSKIIYFFECDTNEKEKILFTYILKNILDMIRIDMLDNGILENIFANPYRKKIIISKYDYLNSFQFDYPRLISSTDENMILDDIGLYVKNELHIKYGELNDSEKEKIFTNIVSKLYNEIFTELKRYNKEIALKCFYQEMEKILYHSMLSRERYKYDVACFPDEKENIDNNISELNKTSLSLKFLIELLSSIKQSDSNEKIDEYGLEFLLAKGFQLIDWAYKNDLFYYKMVSTPVVLLNSNRLGLKHDKISAINEAFKNLRDEQTNVVYYDKLKKLKEELNAEKINNQNFKNIFLCEFGYSIDQLYMFIEYLDEKSFEKKDYICKLDIQTIKKEMKYKLDGSIIDKILDECSLSARENFLEPPSPFKKSDVYPWRFNRDLSFMRRPIIRMDNNILYGTNNLYNSVFYLFDIINKGKFNARSKPMKDYMSKVNKIRGKNFNDLVFMYISRMNNIIVDKNVSKINGLHIADTNGLTLGDIDVLYILPKQKKIVLIEAKDFNSVKNYYELHNEYQNLFVDTDDKKCFLTKHKRRVKWVEEHINDVIIHYHLPNVKYKVYYMFVTSEYCPSKDTLITNENIYSIKELNEKIIFNIKN